MHKCSRPGCAIRIAELVPFGRESMPCQSGPAREHGSCTSTRRAAMLAFYQLGEWIECVAHLYLSASVGVCRVVKCVAYFHLSRAPLVDPVMLSSITCGACICACVSEDCVACPCVICRTR